jgi:hypothetical protein
LAKPVQESAGARPAGVEPQQFENEHGQLVQQQQQPLVRGVEVARDLARQPVTQRRPLLLAGIGELEREAEQSELARALEAAAQRSLRHAPQGALQTLVAADVVVQLADEVELAARVGDAHVHREAAVLAGRVSQAVHERGLAHAAWRQQQDAVGVEPAPQPLDLALAIEEAVALDWVAGDVWCEAWRQEITTDTLYDATVLFSKLGVSAVTC